MCIRSIEFASIIYALRLESGIVLFVACFVLPFITRPLFESLYNLIEPNIHNTQRIPDTEKQTKIKRGGFL